MDRKTLKIGILAYGSLIDDPGVELQPLIIDRILCDTPFKVEFARVSSTRDNAPTLIPVSEGGRTIKAQILVLSDEITTEQAKSMLWRRERHIADVTQEYTRPNNPGINAVLVEQLHHFNGVELVLYTSIGKNIERPITPQLLSDYAISSIRANAGAMEKDGIRYLLSAKKNGIITEFSEEYENEILKKTNTKSLKETIQQLDSERNGERNN
ncbi:MAG TPA: hypothetical protein PLJ60_18980 [Chryseolinea sp.]|nr:hypothetical protein [Chryseolinea sp.]HPM32426.1 hypothetical protein [Chryseolinea sp.]